MSAQVNSIQTFKEGVLSILDIIRDEVNVNEYLPIVTSALFLKKMWRKEINGMTLEEITNEIDRVTSNKDIGVHNFKAYTTVQLFFLPSLEKLKPNTLKAFLTAIDALDSSAITAYFGDAIEAIVFRLNKIVGRFGETNVQPIELTDFLLKLADLRKGDKVYNPFAGLGSFGSNLPNDVSYYGQEINESVYLQAQCRLFAKGNEHKWLHLFREDSIGQWNPRNEKYDLIISNPPFNMKVDSLDNRGRSRTAEQFLLTQGIGDLTLRGKLIVVTSARILSSEGSDKVVRKDLIENDFLEMVISFPGGLLSNTGIAFSVLVINKCKKDKGVVKFIKADSCIENISSRERKLNATALYALIMNESIMDSIRIVPNGTIADNEYNLGASRYFFSRHGKPGVMLTKLSEIMDFVSTNRKSTLQHGKVVRIRELKNDRLDFKLDVEALGAEDVPKNSYELASSALLLALRWNTLKPTYFEYKGESIFISSDIVPVTLNSEVDLEYLINELHSDQVLETLSYLREGITIPSLRRQDLLKVEIELPSMKEQLAKVKGIKEAFIAEKKKEIEAKSKILGLETELFEQNTYLRHSLAGPASNLRGSVKGLKKIIDEHILPVIPNAFDLRGNSNSTLNLGKYLAIIERDVKRISDTLSKATRVETEIDEKKLELVDIIDFLENYTNEIKSQTGLQFTIDFAFDKDAFVDEEGSPIRTYIYANIDLLTDLFNNLIKNAEIHAFCGKTGAPTEKQNHNRIEIYVMINSEMGSGREDEKEVVILVSNTGKGFPENFRISDFIRKGSKGGENAGDGFGGWYINEIVKKFNGALDIIDEQGSEGLPDTDLATSIEIILPIIQYERNENL